MVPSTHSNICKNKDCLLKAYIPFVFLNIVYATLTDRKKVEASAFNFKVSV